MLTRFSVILYDAARGNVINIRLWEHAVIILVYYVP